MKEYVQLLWLLTCNSCCGQLTTNTAIHIHWKVNTVIQYAKINATKQLDLSK